MKKGSGSKGRLSELRQRAEAAFVKESGDVSEASDLSPDDVQRLVHDLRVHQIELEMQNGELRQAQLALEESRDTYLDLYDYAPVGYFTGAHSQERTPGSGTPGIGRGRDPPAQRN